MVRVGELRDPDWERGQWRLPQTEWHEWKKSYLAGSAFQCQVCRKIKPVTLSPGRHVVDFGCGHVMELPLRTDP